MANQQGITDWLNTDPRAAYYSQIPKTGGAQQRYYEQPSLYTNRYSTYLGNLSQDPTQTFLDSLKNFDWRSDWYGRSPNARGSSTRQFSPTARWNVNV